MTHDCYPRTEQSTGNIDRRKTGFGVQKGAERIYSQTLIANRKPLPINGHLLVGLKSNPVEPIK